MLFGSSEVWGTRLAILCMGLVRPPSKQTAMAAAKQDATLRLNDLLVEGRKLATFLRGGVKQR
jgi:hypothetical protein